LLGSYADRHWGNVLFSERINSYLELEHCGFVGNNILHYPHGGKIQIRRSMELALVRLIL